MTAPITVTHFSDPGCPWAYSAMPHIAGLQWRYGDQLEWRLVLIGLTEEARQYAERGYTPATMAQGYRRFRERGMPYSTDPKARVPGTAMACRAVVTTRLDDPAREWEVFRALQYAQFTTTLVFDQPGDIVAALERVDGLDAKGYPGRLFDDDVTEAYEADRAESRTAEGTPTEFQGKSANTDGKVRFTAPSLIFERADGDRLEAGGFQSFEAYEVCIANLDTSLTRRAAPDDVVDALAAFPEGLTTREVSQILAEDKHAPDDDAAEERLIEAACAGRVERETLGSGALWTAR